VSNDIYPGDLPGLTFSVVKTDEESTIVQRAVSGYETRIANFQNPFWHWILEYSVLPDRPGRLLPGYATTEYKFLRGFRLKMLGQFEDFLFDDPTDDTVGPAMNLDGSPNLQAQLLVFDDGAGNFYSPIQRNMGGLFFEDITDLGPGGIAVYTAGVLATGYTVGGPGLGIPGASFEGLYIHWPTEPAQPVTAEFNFYFRVRFESDTQDFEQFAADLWAIGGDGGQKGSGELHLMSSRREF
jgi:hypothetical protein